MFSEDFEDEAGGSTTGTSAEGIDWTVVLANPDKFEVEMVTTESNLCGPINGKALVATDTNGKSALSASVDATDCFLVTVSFDYYLSQPYRTPQMTANVFECLDRCMELRPNTCTGALDEIATNGTSGCNNCWDFISYSFGTSQNETLLVGETCADPQCSSVTSEPGCASAFDMNGDLPQNVDPADTAFALNIVNWADAETTFIDNVAVTCYTESEAMSAGLVVPEGCFAPPAPTQPPSMSSAPSVSSAPSDSMSLSLVGKKGGLGGKKAPSMPESGKKGRR